MKLVHQEKKTAREVIEILKKEYTFEHIGRGESFGFDTVHFTLPGGAPIIPSRSTKRPR